MSGVPLIGPRHYPPLVRSYVLKSCHFISSQLDSDQKDNEFMSLLETFKVEDGAAFLLHDGFLSPAVFFEWFLDYAARGGCAEFVFIGDFCYAGRWIDAMKNESYKVCVYISMLFRL